MPRRSSPQARSRPFYRFHGKLTVLYVVLGCGAIGAVLQLTVL